MTDQVTFSARIGRTFGFPVVAGIEQPNEYFRVAEALERLAKGETQAEIARTFGVHEATVGRLA